MTLEVVRNGREGSEDDRHQGHGDRSDKIGEEVTKVVVHGEPVGV